MRINDKIGKIGKWENGKIKKFIFFNFKERCDCYERGNGTCVYIMWFFCVVRCVNYKCIVCIDIVN